MIESRPAFGGALEQAIAGAFFEHPRYQLVRAIGAGGFGEVYEALDRSTGDRVALKRLVSKRGRNLSRFKQEFRALSGVHHPHLVELRELFEHEEMFCIVMELVPGIDLDRWLSHAQAENENGHVRGYEQIRTTFRSIAEGLCALHAAGLVHRDLKPSNVRVTPEGRVVLLDFGLVSSLDDELQGGSALGAGTAAYMAPEQANGTRVSEAIDWYAFGVCLYQALFGTLPFLGSSQIHILMQKQTRRAELPAVDLPPEHQDLAALCLALLEPTPDQRAGAREVREVLALETSSTDNDLANLSPTRGLTGRHDELGVLEEAFARTLAGDLNIVLVEGEGGIGKSALVSEFASQRRKRGALILRGRCYENELAAYKAFDGCIEDLEHHLSHLPEAECRLMMPQRSGLLAQLFPVLRGVRAIANASDEESPAEPTTRRLEAFTALTRLLKTLARELPLVLVMDDLQWADAESLRLLQFLAESAAKPPVLVLATLRPTREIEGETRQRLLLLRELSCVSTLDLRGLGNRHARDLTRRLLGTEVAESIIARITKESRGHPLFIAELVRHVGSHEPDSERELTLPSAISGRLRTLEPEAREILNFVALSGRPCPRATVRTACGNARGAEAHIRLLLARQWLALRAGDRLACQHEMVRQTIVSTIEQKTRLALYQRLAEATAGSEEADPSELARLWDEAGDRPRARDAYRRAGDLALANLAFTRAENMFARALELCAEGKSTQRAELLTKRAHAFASSGMSADAAVLFEQAARESTGAERTRLSVLSAQQLIQGGRAKEGVQAAKEILAQLGISMPEGISSSIAHLLWHRTLLKGTGLKTHVRTTTSEHDRLVLDALLALSAPLTVIDVLRGSLINVLHLRRALAQGDIRHVASALSQEASFRAIEHPHDPRVGALLERGRALAEEAGDPRTIAYQLFCEGGAAAFAFRFAEQRQKLFTAMRLLEEKCPGDPWLLTLTRMAFGSGLFIMGEHRELTEQSTRFLLEASERRDCFALAALSGMGFGAVRHIIADRPNEATREVSEYAANWGGDFTSMLHFGPAYAAIFSRLYEGGDLAASWFTEHRAHYERGFALRAEFPRVWWNFYGSVSALSAAATGKSTDLTRVVGDARTFSHSKAPFVRAAGMYLNAQVQLLEGRRELALISIQKARAAFEASGAGFFVHAASYLLGILETNNANNDRSRNALSSLANQGWVDPWKGLCMIAPVMRFLEAPPTRRSRAELILGRYQLLGELGRGSSGTVHRALDTHTGRTFALKTLDHVRPSALMRFKREFRARQDVHHPNLVRLDGLFEDAGSFHIAMELVDGKSFRRAARPKGMLAEKPLRRALHGLLDGLKALHEAGLVHRDITSENVLVTPEGRAVLLDFGLIAEADGRHDPEGFVGTPHYAAPEQLDRVAPDPRSDMYAVGVCLFEALTGTLPFPTQKPFLALQQKREQDAPRPSAFTPLLPRDLEGLCIALLQRDPPRRPTAEQALALLNEQAQHVSPSVPAPSSSMRPAGVHDAFVGRTEELAQLQKAAREARNESLRVILIQGESGLGKTALASELFRRLETQDGALVLRSRCYENAQVSYEAFDAGMDTLSARLRERPEDERTRLLPRRRAQLGLLFPALHALLPEAQSLETLQHENPTGRRLHATGALIELLSNVARSMPLILAVDDLQWADHESFELFNALLDAKDTLPCLVVCTIRNDHELSPSCKERVSMLKATGVVSTLHLAGLPASDAERLLRSWVDKEILDSVKVGVGTEHGAGHPLLLREMARKLLSGQAENLAELTLEDALLSRVSALPREPRELLELIAVAGRPYPPDTYRAALDRPEDFEERLSRLLSDRLVRMRGGHELACDHDRTRRLICESIAEPRFREHCRRLAEVLDQAPYAEPAELSRLWDVCGEVERASRCCEAAAQKALEGLSFSRAEGFFALAIARTSPDDRMRLHGMYMGRGRALAHSGRSAEAAEDFERAAAHADGPAAIRAHILCAQSLLQSAQVEPGLHKTFALFRELGAPIPQGATRAFSSFLWTRLRVSMRGLDLAPRPPEPKPDDIVLDAMYELSAPLAWVALLPGVALNNAYLLRALSQGEPKHAARALAMEAISVGIRNSADPAPTERLLVRAEVISREVDEPSTHAFVSAARASVRLMHFDLQGATEGFRNAARLLSSRDVDEPWMLTSIRMNFSCSLYATGEHVEARALCEEWLEEARARRDRFAIAALTGLGFGFVRHLFRDDPDAAREELQDALKHIPSEPLGYAHIGEFIGNALISSYSGSSHGYHWFEAQERRHERAFLLQTEFSRTWLESYRALACLGALADVAFENRAPLLSATERAGTKLSKMKPAFSRHLGDFALAQVSAARGQIEDALARLLRARQAFASSGVRTYEIAALYLEGLLRGGDLGREYVDRAVTLRAEQGYQEPERALAMHVPVVRVL